MTSRQIPFVQPLDPVLPGREVTSHRRAITARNRFGRDPFVRGAIARGLRCAALGLLLAPMGTVGAMAEEVAESQPSQLSKEDQRSLRAFLAQCLHLKGVTVNRDVDLVLHLTFGGDGRPLRDGVRIVDTSLPEKVRLQLQDRMRRQLRNCGPGGFILPERMRGKVKEARQSVHLVAPGSDNPDHCVCEAKP